MPSQPSKDIDTFPNPKPERPYHVHIEVPEFTCLCPLTGQPDFAHLTIDYLPDQRNLELRSLKLYMWSFRNDGAFHEAVTNKITDDLVAACAPRFLRLTAKWYVRGGLFTTVIAEHRAADWTPTPRIELGSFDAQPSTRNA